MAIGWLCFLLLIPVQDEIVKEDLDTTTVRDLFTEANHKYNSVQRIESEPIFRQIVQTLENKANPDEDELFILTESLKYLGVINYPTETEAWYEKLIRLNPNYSFDAKDIPPKIIAVMDDLKQRLLGYVLVSATDASNGGALENAELLVDEKLIGPIHGKTRYATLAGTRQIEIRKTNYESSFVSLDILPDQESSYEGVLLRNAAALVLVTSPAEVSIRLNDVAHGVTGEAAPSGYAKPLADLGVAKDEAGSVTLNGLAPGTYTLTFEKDCYKPKVNTIEVTELKQVFVTPIVMAPAEAFLTVNTADKDSGGLLYLGEQRVGFLPIANHKICPGDYVLKVQFTDGQYIKNLTLADGEQREIVAQPLPSLVWFGVEESEDGGPPLDIEASLHGLQTWNVRPVDPRDTSLVPVNPFSVLFGGKEMSEQNDGLLTRHLRADLYVAARVIRKKVVVRFLEVAFWTPLSKRIQVMSFDFREIMKFEDLLQSMDAFPPLIRPWLGIQTAKLRGLPGCKIIEVHPNGPLAGKTNAGAFVQAVNGNVLRNPGELFNLDNTRPVTLELSAGQSVTVTPTPTIAEVAYESTAMVPQALLAKFEKLAKYNPDPLVRKSALFNQARYQFFLGDYKWAFDIFSSLTLDTPYGVNKGSLLYYQGLCFRRLNLVNEAAESFRKVQNYPNATLFDAYGPKAAFWAEAETSN